MVQFLQDMATSSYTIPGTWNEMAPKGNADVVNKNNHTYAFPATRQNAFPSSMSRLICVLGIGEGPSNHLLQAEYF